MPISMTRGYGLPSEGASSYNGYGNYRFRGFGLVNPLLQHEARQRRAQALLMRPLPDPELGDYRGFGDFGYDPNAPKLTEQTMEPQPTITATGEKIYVKPPPRYTQTTSTPTPGTTPTTNTQPNPAPTENNMLPILLGVGCIALFFIMKKKG